MKFYGKVGYAESVAPAEDNPGVWKERIVEKPYYGDVLSFTRRVESSQDSTIDDINISNRISIIADPYAMQNFMNIEYVIFGGAKWKVPTVDVEYPRLILRLGGLWNG